MKSELMTVLAIGLLALSGCGAKSTCSPGTCNGCCDVNNLCQSGTVPQACGASALTCSVCSAGQQCLLGVCSNSASGGGTNSGGGSATGGGLGTDAGPTDDGGVRDGGIDGGSSSSDAGTVIDAGPAWDGGPGIPVDTGPLRIFTTSRLFYGKFTFYAGLNDGLRGADTMCQLVADSVNLGGTWTAFLGSTTVPAMTRFTATGPWVEIGTNDTVAFADMNALATLVPAVLTNRDETGTELSVPRAWTGTRTFVDGGVINDCDHWNSWAGLVVGDRGVPDEFARWSNDHAEGCSTPSSLYCFEQSKLRPDGGAAYPSPSAPKRLFMTSTRFSGALTDHANVTVGVEAGDALCTTAAHNASLGGQWKAWLSDYTHPAIARFTFAGPWKLIGTNDIVFRNLEQVAVGEPLRQIDRTERGTVITGSTSLLAWTGTGLGGQPLGNCSGWTSFDNGQSGVIARGYAASGYWANVNIERCDFPMSLYCFEQ